MRSVCSLLPYVFTSTEQKYKVLDGAIGTEVMNALSKYNMVGLEFWKRDRVTSTPPRSRSRALLT